MRYVEIHPGMVALHEGDPPRPAPSDARVRVLACGVCGTDVHALHGMVLPRGATYPIHPGHEVAGIVEELGSQTAAETDITVGDPSCCTRSLRAGSARPVIAARTSAARTSSRWACT